MTMLGKKLLSVLMALMMLLSLVPAAMAEGTALKVDFKGMYATHLGEYEAVALSGAFEVYQDNRLIGTLNVTPGGDNTIALDGAGTVHLVPVMSSIPPEIPLSEYGYSVSVVEGRLNIAPLNVRANAGLFVVRTEGSAEFELTNDAGYVLNFSTGEKGEYAVKHAIPAGVYTLKMLSAQGVMWPEQIIEIVNYSGEASILVVENVVPVVEVTAAPVVTEAPTPVPTEVPTATPVPTEVPTATPAPTEAPTATPAPTEAPTATPVPTEAPTATPVPTPTATPVPTHGTLVVEAQGADVSVGYSFSSGDKVIQGGMLYASSPVRAEKLSQGEYLVTLTLPNNVALTALNGNPTIQRGTARWMASVKAMQESVYTVELTRTGSLLVPFVNVTSATVAVKGPRDSASVQAEANSACSVGNLLPDNYTVTVSLPKGQYQYDENQWKLTAGADGTMSLTAACTVSSSETTVLTPVTRIVTGSVSGVVNGTDGKALKGVKVTLLDAKGSEQGAATTDQNGAWAFKDLPFGAYSVQYAFDGMAIPVGSFTLDDVNGAAALTAQAAKPAKINVRVFLDENNNGSFGKGEDLIKDVELALVTENGTVAATALTGKDGTATLSAPAGKYTLRVTVEAGYGFGKKGEGYNFTNSIMAESSDRTQNSLLLTLSTEKTLEVGVGVQELAKVTGTVWNDLNADGIWQENEPGIPGIRVTIEGGRNDDFFETVTDENGYYELTQIKKGNYELTCHVPDEYVFTVKAKGKNDTAKISRMTTEADRAGVDTISLDRGEVHDNHNIGMMDGVIIEGVCFLDMNGNGYYDEGEKPLPGVEMRLARQSNNVMLQNTTSDENGVYHFYGQRGSTFTIRANLPAGYVFTAQADGENGNRFAPNGTKTERRLTDVTVENGGYLKVMLGAVSFGSISGKVYYDDNFSGAWEKGEPVDNSFLVTLLDANGEKVISRRTDANGNYSFTDLQPGQYTLKMTPAKGYAFTALGEGNVMKTLADGTGLSEVITLTMGDNLTGVNAGMIKPATVTGTVFADANDNGAKEQGEKGLAGAVVRLMTSEGEFASATVDASGAYTFNALLPGKYYLQYELPENGVFSPVAAGGNVISGSDGGVGTGEWFTVDVGDAYSAPLCGGLLLSDISGIAFGDVNGNGVMDADETALQGMTISLEPSRSDLKGVTIVTGPDGKFAMNGLRPDTYTLTVTCPTGCVLSRMPEASLGLAHGLNTQSIQLKLDMGTRKLEQQLGCVLPSTWTGEAYLDENYDGKRGADEAPASGETIILRDAKSGEDVASVLTDENGLFTIEGIAPGEYELVFVLDDGCLEPKKGDNDLHQDGNVMTTGYVQIKENEDKSGTLIAIARTTEIAGDVWLETFNGVTAIEGAKVFLLDGSGKQIAEFATGSDGSYAFKGLMPGAYGLEVTIPNGYTLVESSDPHLAEAGLISVVEEATGLHGKSAAIDLRMARHQRDMDIGAVLPGRLGDKVWLDLDGNGLQDGDEGGIPGVTIELLRGERIIATTVSDQYGYFVFENLYPTEYTLRVTWPAEVRPTTMRTDVWQIVSVLQENGLSIPVTVESNKANYAADLGFVLVEEGKYPAGYGEGAAQIWD